MWDLFFGPDRSDDIEFVRIGPRVYDIDVVSGLVVILKSDLAEQDDAMYAAHAANPGPALMPSDLPSKLYPIIVEVMPRPLPGAPVTDPERVDVTEVPGLSRPERARLRVTGAQARVDFMQRGFPDVWSSRQEVRDRIEHYLRAQGRRRFPGLRLLATLPALAGISLIPLWIAAIVGEHFGVVTAVFGALIAIGGFVAGIIASRTLARQAATQMKGHRFREATREDFRAAVTNVRAGVLTTAGGTVVGVVLTVIFYKLTGIDPV